MKRSLYFSLILGTGVVLGSFFVRPFERAFEEVPAHAAGGRGQGAGAIVVSGNGDVNGDNGLDLSDAIYLLAHLFQGGPAPEVCPGGGGNCPGCQADLLTCEADLQACRGAVSEICDDGKDNDLDCDTDCRDSDCTEEDICTTLGTPTFTQGDDNPEGHPTYTHDQTGIVFVLLAGGEFPMGSPPGELNRDGVLESPLHNVTLDAFLMSETEVTQAQYFNVTGLTPSRFSTDGQQPVEMVSWDDLNNIVGGGFLHKTGLQLPTEAQWEYAARGDTSTAFSWGDDCNVTNHVPCEPADSHMWWAANAQAPIMPIGTRPVRTRDPNDFGLYDMHGNVSEWCREEFALYTTMNWNPGDGERQGGSFTRVARGGSWEDSASLARSAARNELTDPNFKGHANGFRLAAPAP